jgi:predicted metalloprotease with PDZ domain
MATWRDYLGETVSYYRLGLVLGALLDLSILHDTRGTRGLDDVMRTLYREFYKLHRGFTPDDLVQTVSSVAGRDYSDFFSRFVNGTDLLPYDSILRFAGVEASETTTIRGLIGGFGTRLEQGIRLDSLQGEGVGATAGLRKGDVIVAVDGIPVDKVANYLPNGCCFENVREGDTKVLTIVRDGARLDVAVALRPLRITSQRVEFSAAPSNEQLEIRNTWLRKSPDASVR